MNPASYLILSVVALAFMADIIYLYLSKRKGKCVGCAVTLTSNGGTKKAAGCSGCPVTNRCNSSSSCH